MMITKFWRKNLFLWLVPWLFLVGCQATAVSNDTLDGRILIWHSWPETEQAVLDNVLQEFRDIHPDVTIISTYVPPNELRQRYETTVPQGLGPNLIIGDADWIPALAAADLVAELNQYQVTTFDFLASTLRKLRRPGESGLYGLPLAVGTRVLYYNATMVARPFSTIDEMFAASEGDDRVALPVTFEDAYWGIQAYGAGLFNSSGEFDLTDSGLIPWLTVLKDAQEAPNLITSRDLVALRQLFIDGEVAYYIGRPEDLDILNDAIGEFAVGVATLPQGPTGAAGPLLRVEALMLNPASSAKQTALAVTVAQFLTNEEQSTIFMRETGRVPANRQVEVNFRIYPNIAAFATQSRTAVFLPNGVSLTDLSELGNLTYANVLSGLQTPLEAVCDFGRSVIDRYPDLAAENALPSNCPPPETEGSQ